MKKNFIGKCKAAWTMLFAAVLVGMAVTSCGEQKLADKIEGKWKGDIDLLGLNEDGVKYKNGETILEFAKSGADADGGKFTMTVSMDITGEEDGMEISASIDVVAPGKWRVESNDIEVTYNSADMKFNIKKLDLKPSGDADSETMMAFALAKEAGMLDEDVLKEAVLQSIKEEVGDDGEVTTDKLGLVSVSGDVLEFNDEDLGKVQLTKVP